VRNGVRRAGEAARRLGPRLARTPVGRALRNGANRLRDGYRRQRDRYRSWRNQRTDRRRDRDRRKQERQHDDRLARAVQRMRPRLARLLRRVVRPAVLTAALGAMRLWYRLSRLRAEGTGLFDIKAWASPPALVIEGTTIRFEAREILQFIEELAAEIQRDRVRRRRPQPHGRSNADDEKDEFSLTDQAPAAGTMADLMGRHEESRPFPEPTQGMRDGRPVTTPGMSSFTWGGLVTVLKNFGGRNLFIEGWGAFRSTKYKKMAAQERGEGNLVQLGDDLRRIFQGRPTRRPENDAVVRKGRFLVALTSYIEARRDPTARVYAALMVERIVTASARNDANAAAAAIEDFPMAAIGAEGASISKRAWVAGEEFEVQRAAVQAQAAAERAQINQAQSSGNITADEARERRKAVTRERSRKLTAIQGKQPTPKDPEGKVSGEELAAREIRYLKTYLEAYLGNTLENVPPAAHKKAVLDFLRSQVMRAYRFRGQ
ncbi:hypothetical protein AB0F81_49630, partial [Actinoplanes sp. NPDC024001]|uniref:hypothetical protein n=1 Tax=Actinoplanes sp. NPDC024001 TaxID=3154598 RepID=UPI0033DD85C1